MKRMALIISTFAIVLQVVLGAQDSTNALHSVRASDGTSLRSLDAIVQSMLNTGELRASSTERDALIPNHTVERLAQFHDGIPVFGANVVRDTASGVTASVFGELVSTFSTSQPRFDTARASSLFESIAGERGHVIRAPALTFLPFGNTSATLAYMATYADDDGGVWIVFLDAATGDELIRLTDLQTDSAVSTGRGVLGDQKKLSTSKEAGAYFADDKLRPPMLVTFDMRGSLSHTVAVSQGQPLVPSDRASSATNSWSDAAAVDAQAHIGWAYDYYYNRFGRRGLDNHDRSLLSLIHNVTQQQALNVSTAVFNKYVINAFWCTDCGGLMIFGDGIPSDYYNVDSGQKVTYLAGALDVIAHELTHGVTNSTSQLVYLGESGALNESFSDIIGTSVEFAYQPAGNGLRQADYLIGEDVFRAFLPGSLNGIRSMSNPSLFGDPDHYSRRLLLPLSIDGGGVHFNSAIPNQAFFLAIEGGTNRTSGVTVQGVGAAKREQIEKVFYRAFTLLLPSSAGFSTARAATIQSARDLYGAGGSVEQAVTAAWTAVGVN